MRPRGTVARVAALSFFLLGVVAARYLWLEARSKADWREGIAAGIRRFEPAAIAPAMSFPPELRESSGVVASSRNRGVVWTHNDSGNSPVVYGVRPGDDPEKGIVARLHLAGAPASDWEDIARGPCPLKPAVSCLYVADIGDNFRRRSSVAVIVFEEPLLTTSDHQALDVEWSAASVRYPDGPVDAEGVAVSEAGDLIVVTKEKGGIGRVFRLSRDDLATALKGGRALMQPAGTVGTRWESAVTAAAWGGGDELVVRTIHEVFFWRQDGDGWTQARPPCFIGHAGRAGEGLDAPVPGVLYLTREADRKRPAGLDVAVCAR